VALIADSETGVVVYRGVTPLTTIELSKIPALLRRLAAANSIRVSGQALRIGGCRARARDLSIPA
jgi:hypothetical protein